MMLVPRAARYSRRALLKRLGVGLGTLPLLHAERVLAQGPRSPGVAKRLVTITWGNGVVPGNFYPPAGPLAATLPPILAPLGPWKDKLLVVRGPGMTDADMGGIDVRAMVDANNSFGGHLSYPALLTGTATGTQPSIDTIYADQLVALGFAKPQLNVGCRPESSSTSWRAGQVKNTSEVDPYRLFTTLFGGASIPADQIATLLPRRRSVLDHVRTELAAFQGRIGSDDRRKVQAHLDSVRQIESQLSAISAPATSCLPTQVTPGGLNFRSVANFPTHVKMMMDLVAAAVKCDLARAITMDLVSNTGGNTLTFPWLGIPSPDFHGLAHLGSTDYGDKTAIDTWFFSQVANLVGQLAATPEGDGSSTALDNTVVLVTSDMNQGAFHDVRSLPVVIAGSAGGFFKNGACVQLAANAPNNQLLTSICHALDLPVTTVGEPGNPYQGDLDRELAA